MIISRHERAAKTEVQLSEFFPPVEKSGYREKGIFFPQKFHPLYRVKESLAITCSSLHALQRKTIPMFQDLFLDSHVAMFLLSF